MASIKMPSLVRLGKNWRFLEVEDELYLFNIVSSKRLKLKGQKEFLRFLFKLLTQNTHKTLLFNEISSQFPNINKGRVQALLYQLEAKKILENDKPRQNHFPPRYLLGLERQLAFFSELNNKGIFANQSLLKNAKIAVLGLGSVSHYIIIPLIASGVGFFKCIDFDEVEARNIGRQPIFRRDDIGKLKTEVVGKFIKEARKGVKCETVNKLLKSEKDVGKVILDCDLVLQCCDVPRFIVHRWITKACLKLKKPNLLVYSGRVGPFCIPYKTACYGCLEIYLKRRFKFYDALVNKITNEEITRFPELPVLTSLTGTLAAKEVVGHILGITPKTYTHFYDLNPFALEIIERPLKRQKRCQLCSQEYEKPKIQAKN